MVSKRYESTEVDHRTWLHVPSGTFNSMLGPYLWNLKYEYTINSNTLPLSSVPIRRSSRVYFYTRRYPFTLWSEVNR